MLNFWSLAQRTRPIRANPALGYPLALLLVGLAILVRFVAGSVLYPFPILTFYLPVIVAAFLCGPGPALMTVALGTSLSAYFLLQVPNPLHFEGVGLLIALAFYICTNGLIIALMDGMLKAMESQHATAQRLQLAMEAGGLAVFEYELAQEKVVATPELNRLLGFAPATGIDVAQVRGLVRPHDWDRLRVAARQAIQSGRPDFELEFQMRRPDGVLRWYCLSAQIQREKTAEKILGVLSDITARKELGETRELLLKEMEHRIKNMLATVGAITGQTLRGDITLPEARKLLDGRFAALGLAHQLLIRRQWRDARLRDVAETALDPYLASGQIAIGGPDCALSPRRALAMTLALHELATNAIKYGALSGPSGSVSVSWETEKGRLLFCWRETGGPVVTAPVRRGFGTQIIERVLAADFGGQVTMDWQPQGLSCTLSCPLHEV